MTPEQRTQAAQHIIEHYPVSKAQACRIVKISRGALYYEKKMPMKDLKMKQVISQAIANRRIGREKAIRLVQKQHPKIGSSKIRRVYQNEGFSLFKRLKRRKKQQVANPIEVPMSANKEWAMDFMSDALANRIRFRTMNVIDHYDRACKGIVVSKSFPAYKVTEQLAIMIDIHGKPEKIRTDNGPEFRSKKFQLWLKQNGIAWSPIQNGKPQQNGIVERFNRSYREHVLDSNIFGSIENAQHLTDKWVHEYNHEIPHQALNYQTPSEYAA